MRRSLLFTLLFLLASASLVGANPTLKAKVGYGSGLFAPAKPVPVRVSLSLGEGEPAFAGVLVLEAWQEEGGAPRCIHALEEVELGPGSAKSYLLGFRADRSKGVRLRLLKENKVVAEAVFAYGVELREVPPGVPFVATLRVKEGRTRLYWPTTFRHVAEKDTSTPTSGVAIEIGAEMLAPNGLEGLDALIVSEGQAVEPGAARALETWVREGGQLLVSPGPRILDEGHPLSRLLPFTATGQRRVRGAVFGLDAGEAEGSASLVTGRVKPGAWIGHSAPDGTPVLVSGALGRGRVSFLAIPLRDRALGPEEVRAALFAKAFLLGSLQPRGTERTDVLEQSSLALDLETASGRVDRTWISLLIILFLFVVGPLDYLLWRWRPGPRTTWITLIASSLGFSVLAFVVGTSGRGPGLEVQSTWVVDCFPDGTTALDGLVVFAGRRHASFSVDLAEGLRVYPSGVSDESAARLQGDLVILPRKLRFNLGLGACMPVRVRGLVATAAPPLPVAVRRLDGQEIEIENLSEEPYLDLVVVGRDGFLRRRLVKATVKIDLSRLESHGNLRVPFVDGEGLMRQAHDLRGLWPTAAAQLAAKAEKGGFGGFKAFAEPVEAISWGLDRSLWLERGHVVVIVKVRGSPNVLQGRDLPAAAERGWTYYRVHLSPGVELEARDPDEVEGVPGRTRRAWTPAPSATP
ncbi:MAG: hypothetical protein JKY65_21630, partial [Planctomycetes bacterium]|nr:hypothetical protein [Planctomycetota bacterium]